MMLSTLETLREIKRLLLRARRILLTQGTATLFRRIKQSARQPSSACDCHKPQLIELTEPYPPVIFADLAAPSVSIIVTFGGDARLTHGCMAALGGLHTRYPFEVLLVHNGSCRGGACDGHLWENVRDVVVSCPLNTAAARNRGAARAAGEFLVFLSDRTQVAPGWLDALIETFALRPDSGIVGSRLLSSGGRVLSAGGVIQSEGLLSWIGHGEDRQRPEFSYLRPVDFSSGVSIAIRRTLFEDLEGFDEEFGRSAYKDVDLAFRARKAGSEVYCQPQSEVIFLSAGKDEETVPDSNRIEGRCRTRFRRRWEGEVCGRQSRPKRHAFVSDFAIPMPDRDSGSLRMVSFLTLLQEQGFSITFASMGLEARQPYLSRLQRAGIECLYRPFEKSCAEHLRRHGHRYDLIVLSRLDTAGELLPIARRYCPRARVVFDTVDLHFLRIAREADITNDSRTRRIAERTKRLELDLVRQAGTTLVVSEAERSLLALEVPEADVRVLSNVHQVVPSETPFDQRQDILFIGGFSHPPNTDAVIYFCRDIFPGVAEALPGVRFYVIGSDPPRGVSSLASENVRILGHVRDVEPHWRQCRLSVAPLRFGAGVKGKITQSLAHGVPVVATSVAAEGMFLVNGRSALIADDPDAFVEAVVRLYEDESLWRRLSHAGTVLIEHRFSFDAARAAVNDLLRT